MRVGQGHTNFGGRLGRRVGFTFFVGFAALSMGMGDCEEGNTGFVTITPETGAVFTSAQTVTIEATVLDELLSDVSKLEFYDGEMDGQPKCTDAIGPDYQCAWPVTGADNGTHSWTARAYFGNGSTIDSKTVELTVDISPGTRGNGPPGSLGTGLVGTVQGVGTAADVVVQNGIAYMASSEFGLSIVDVTDPSRPEMLGVSSVPFQGFRVAAEGDFAVVAGDRELWVVDVSDPVRPTPVGSILGSFKSLVLAGDVVYGLLGVPGNPAHIELTVVDLSAPQAPTIVGSTVLAGGRDLAVVGSFAYVAAAGSGLQIADISNPTRPTIIKTVDTPGGAVGVAVGNGHAYVADSTSVQIIDVHNPANASVVGSLDESARAVEVVGNSVYTTSGGFKIIDVSNPSNPWLRGALYDGNINMAGLDLQGSHAFVASPDQGLYVVNVSASTQPWKVTNLHGVQRSTHVAALGPVAVATSQDGLDVVDVSDPSLPTPIGHVAGSFGSVALAGEFAYALLGVSGNPPYTELAVVDLSVPESPSIVGSQRLAGGSAIEVAGSLAYVAAAGAGLQIVNISNPSAPAVITTVDTPNGARGVKVQGGYAYVADSTSVQIIDVHDPANAFVVGSLSEYAQSVAVAGNTLYATSGTHFRIIDVSNPAAPWLRSTLDGIDATAVEVVGDRAYLSKPMLSASAIRGAVLVVDISDPDSPEIIDQIEVPGFANSLTLDGDFVYVADSAAMIDVIRVSP